MFYANDRVKREPQIDQFLRKMGQRFEKIGVSAERRASLMAGLEDKYRDSDIFCPLSDFIDDDDFCIEYKEDDINVDDLMTANERVEAMQKKFDNENVFEKEEMIEVNEEPINKRGKCGRTMLHEAVLANDMIRVQDLLAQGADPTIMDNNEHTPYTMAVLHEREDIVSVFEALGIDE